MNIKSVLSIALLTLAVVAHAECSIFSKFSLSGFISQLLMPVCDKAGVKFATIKSKIPDQIEWKQIGFAKELINQLKKVVVISGGANPIPLTTWDTFKPFFPWQKNIDRNLLFQKTSFFRSPHTDVNCQNATCIKQRDYRSYTWIDLAEPVCVTYIPGKTDILKPDAGYLVVKTIIKCQAIYFEDFIYQLTDNKGNFYAMHAFENGEPDLSVILPAGWSLSKVALATPLIISPFGGGNNCYFNIVGDHLGQGYHQYTFASSYYPG